MESKVNWKGVAALGGLDVVNSELVRGAAHVQLWDRVRDWSPSSFKATPILNPRPLTHVVITNDRYVTAADVKWTGVTITSECATVEINTHIVSVHAFGGRQKVLGGGDFTIVWDRKYGILDWCDVLEYHQGMVEAGLFGAIALPTLVAVKNNLLDIEQQLSR